MFQRRWQAGPDDGMGSVSPGSLAFTLLIGAGTVIVAIVAARGAARPRAARAPCLPGTWPGARRVRGRHPVQRPWRTGRDSRPCRALALILAEGGLTTNWGRAPGLPGRRGGRAGHGGGRGVDRRGRRVRPLAARLLLAVGPAARGGARADGRRGRVLGAAPPAAAATAMGILEGESGLNDPAIGARRHPPVGFKQADIIRRAWALPCGEVAWELIGGLAMGLAVGLHRGGFSYAGPRCPPPGCTQSR